MSLWGLSSLSVCTVGQRYGAATGPTRLSQPGKMFAQLRRKTAVLVVKRVGTIKDIFVRDPWGQHSCQRHALGGTVGTAVGAVCHRASRGCGRPGQDRDIPHTETYIWNILLF